MSAYKSKALLTSPKKSGNNSKSKFALPSPFQKKNSITKSPIKVSVTEVSVPNHHRGKSFLPKIKSVKEILSEIELLKPKELGSIFLTIDKRNKKFRPKVKNNILKLNNRRESRNVGEISSFNVFSNEDHVIKDLMIQFDEKEKKRKLPKLERQKGVLDKLYGISPEALEKMQNAKNNKKMSLEDYQQNILSSIDAGAFDQQEIMTLVENFKDLQIESDSVQPLPPINVDIIRDHVCRQKNESLKKMSMKEYLGKNKESLLDEFEKEQRLIRNIRSFKAIPKNKRNHNLERLPPHLREAFSKKLNYHN